MSRVFTVTPEMVAELRTIAPLVIVSVGSFVLLLADVFLRRKWPRGAFTAAVLLAALAAAVRSQGDFVPGRLVWSGTVFADPFTWSLSVLVLSGTLLSLLMTVGRTARFGVESPAEFYALLLMTVAGCLVFVSAAEFVTLFLGLEILSMALYCLCGSAPGDKRSSESALKYFLLGSFSSAFLLYGIAFVYGLTGSTSLADAAARLGDADPVLSSFALGLVLVGLMFKCGAAPFHFWVPDVYQGAPTPVTAFMACVVKTVAVAVSLRVLWVTFGRFEPQWSGGIWLVAIASIVAGNLAAVRQRNVKRMLAYSSVAHAGYLSAALLVPSNIYGGGTAVLYYLVAYTFMTLGAFAVVSVVTSADHGMPDADDLSRYRGLGGRRPALAAAMAFFMLALAGLPPGMAGLVGKFYVFGATVQAGFIGLTLVAVLGSAVSCYYYLRVVVVMYFGGRSGAEEPGAHAEIPFPVAALLLTCVLAVVLLGIFPSPLYDRSAVIMNSIVSDFS